MKKILTILVGLLLIPTALAMNTCDDWVTASEDCEVITPVLSCGSYTYDLYNSTHDLVTDDGAMTEIGSSDTYNFTFNQADSGSHLIVLCDNSTTTINVGLDEVNATDIPDVSINSTAVAEAVWDYDISSIATSGFAGTILNAMYTIIQNIQTIVEYIEQLI